LLDQVIAGQANRAPSAAINAMALCVVQDENVSAEKLRSWTALLPSPMTFRFLETLIGNLQKKKIG
jgi:hypothetical protein